MSAGQGTSRAKAHPEPPGGDPSQSPASAAGSRFQFPEIFQQLQDLFLVLDLSGGITSCNEGVSSYGFSSEELIGNHLGILFAPDQRSLIDHTIPAALNQGRFETEIKGRTKAGQERRVHLCVSRLVDGRSAPIGLLAIGIDSTDRTLPVPTETGSEAGSDERLQRVRSVEGVEFVIASPLMQKFMGLVDRVAGHTETVLIIGETGTGKELVARTIHTSSHRASQRLVDINCAALPEHLVESELFGYEKGAFSGADAAKPGLFELADKSTIFLDEIGELQTQIQVKLLRVLDGSAYYRLGGHRKIVVDVRVVAATNQDLEAAVKEGKFRKDLYHRLSQFQLRVPPLRERPEDVVALARHFLALKAPEKLLSSDALAALQNHDWPGNVRELRSLVAKLAITSQAREISRRDLLQELAIDRVSAVSVALPTDLDSMEEQMIVRALEATGGHRAQAAEKLGISRRTLSRKLREYQIDAPSGVKGQTLGTISQDQQKFFRAKVEIPVTLRSSNGDECQVKAQNLSTGGMGLEGIEEGDRFAGLLDAIFALPESGEEMNCKVRLVWADAAGRAGARFVTIDPIQFQKLQAWTNRQMEREGWELPS